MKLRLDDDGNKWIKTMIQQRVNKPLTKDIREEFLTKQSCHSNKGKSRWRQFVIKETF